MVHIVLSLRQPCKYQKVQYVDVTIEEAFDQVTTAMLVRFLEVQRAGVQHAVCCAVRHAACFAARHALGLQQLVAVLQQQCTANMYHNS